MVTSAQTRRWWRPLRPEEYSVQFASIEEKLNRSSLKLEEALRAALGVVSDNVIRASLDIRNQRDWEEVRGLLVADDMAAYRSVIKRSLNDVYQFSKARTAQELGVNLPVTSKDFLEWLESKSQILAGLHTAVLAARVQATVLGASSKEVLPARIKRVFSEFADNELAKGADLSGILALQAGRDDVAAGASDQIISWTWSAILDHRTCKTCRRLDGTTWTADDPSIIHPPIHFWCRCLLVGTLVSARYKPEITGLPEGFSLPEPNRRFIEALGGYNAR